MTLTRLLAFPILVFLAFSNQQLTAQRISVSPSTLYPGENIVTVESSAGIRTVRVIPPRGMEGYVEARKTGIIGGCPNSRDIEISISTASVPIVISVYVEECDGGAETFRVRMDQSWQVATLYLPDAEVGEEVCRQFSITSNEGNYYLDSVSIPEPQAFTRFSDPPPYLIFSDIPYHYNVCFKAEKPGIYKFPVITWIRRERSEGGYTTYPVADTGIIKVVEKRESILLGDIPFDTMSRDNPAPVTDPTIFRSVAIPNAVIPPKGKFFIGNYDLLGLTFGYAVADELLLFAGGAAPTPDDWGGVNGDMFGAWSFGGKLGTRLFGKLNIAAGYHYGQSILDKEFTPDEIDSRITVSVPYGAISYGTDDNRVSVTAGYAFKRHSTWITDDPVLPPLRDEYNKDAAFGSLGGDYRFARHWKIVGEFAMMQTVDVAPIILTARYFTNTFAIDMGAAYAGITLNNAEPPPFPLLPMLSVIFVF